MSKKEDPLLGVTIDGRYTLLARLGGGGMGAVYTAEQSAMNRVVVVKILHFHLSKDKDKDEFIARFKREAQTASRVEHRNAVAIYDFGIWKDQPYIVMQYNTGESLKSILRREAPLTPERCLVIMEQVFSALNAAHKLNIVHRDLKPDNIMCTLVEGASEVVQVLDFGLAKVMSETETEMAVTRTGIVMGTPQYMAPEQAIAATLDARTDIYALGIMLFEMLTGEVPFTAESPVQLMFKHIKEKPEPMGKKCPGLSFSAELEKVVAKALKKEPNNRFLTVEEFGRELRLAIECNSASKVSLPQDPEIAVVVTNEKKSATKVSNDTKRLSADLINNEQIDRAGKRSWPLLTATLVVLLLCSIGFFYEPLYAIFNPEEAARRAARLKLDQEIGKHLDLAKEFSKKKDFRAAEYELQRALGVERRADVFVELAKTYSLWGRYEQAQVVLDNALSIDNESAEIHLVLADLQLRRGKFEQAARAYQSVLELDPGNKSAEKSLGICRQKLRSARNF